MADFATVLRLIVSGDSQGAVAALEEVQAATGATAAKSEVANAAVATQTASMGKVAVGAGAGFLALGALIAVSTDRYVKWGEEVLKGSEMTGMSTEAYSKFAGEWKAYNIDINAGTMAMKFFEKQTYAAEQGTKASVDAFQQLGISVDQLKLMPPAEALALVRDRLSQVTNSAERTALMVQLFGRGGAAFTLWANASTSDIGKVDDALQKNGQILTGPQAKALHEAGVAWRAMSLEAQGFAFSLAREVLPVVTDGLKILGLLFGILEKLGPVFPILAGALGTLALAFGAVWAAEKVFTMWTTVSQAALGLMNTTAGIAAVRDGELTAAELRLSLAQKDLAASTAVGTEAIGAEGVAAEGAAVAETGAATATAGLGASMLALATGPLAVLIAGYFALKEVMGAVNAYEQAQAAKKTEATQFQGTMNNYQMAQDHINAWKAAHPGMPLPPDYQTLQNEINANMKSDALSHANVQTMAAGGDFVTRGPQLILVGDNPGGQERVKVTPLAGGTGGDGIHLHLHASFLAMPSREQLRQVMGMMGEELRLARGALV